MEITGYLMLIKTGPALPTVLLLFLTLFVLPKCVKRKPREYKTSSRRRKEQQIESQSHSQAGEITPTTTKSNVNQSDGSAVSLGPLANTPNAAAPETNPAFTPRNFPTTPAQSVDLRSEVSAIPPTTPTATTKSKSKSDDQKREVEGKAATPTGSTDTKKTASNPEREKENKEDPFIVNKVGITDGPKLEMPVEEPVKRKKKKRKTLRAHSYRPPNESQLRGKSPAQMRGGQLEVQIKFDPAKSTGFAPKTQKPQMVIEEMLKHN